MIAVGNFDPGASSWVPGNWFARNFGKPRRADIPDERASAARAQRPAPRGGRPIRRGAGSLSLAPAARCFRPGDAAAGTKASTAKWRRVMHVIHSHAQQFTEKEKVDKKKERNGRLRPSSSLPTTTPTARRKDSELQRPVNVLQAHSWMRKCCITRAPPLHR